MKLITSFKVLAVVALLAQVGSAAAQTIYFAPSLFYKTYNDTWQTTSSSAESEREFTDTYYDIRLGVRLDSGLYVGAIYSQMDRDFNGTDNVRTSYGASIGYMQDQGWYIIGHYFLSSEYELSDTFTLTSGSGFQGDLGYYFPIGQDFLLGPQLSYKNFTYDEYDSGTSTGLELEKGDSSELLPMVALAIRF